MGYMYAHLFVCMCLPVVPVLLVWDILVCVTQFTGTCLIIYIIYYIYIYLEKNYLAT